MEMLQMPASHLSTWTGMDFICPATIPKALFWPHFRLFDKRRRDPGLVEGRFISYNSCESARGGGDKYCGIHW